MSGTHTEGQTQTHTLVIRQRQQKKTVCCTVGVYEKKRKTNNHYIVNRTDGNSMGRARLK